MRSSRLARLTALAVPFLATSPGLAGAQQRGRADSIAADSARHVAALAAVVTTATRAPAPLAGVAQRVRVVGPAEIDATPSLDVADLLKRAAGVDIVQYGSLLSGIGIRGFRPETGGLQKRTLLLVDGRPADVTNLALLDLAGIERIEVLKGAASSLYGSSAEGGVVNVITRRTTDGRSASLSAGAGSFATTEVVGHAGGVLGSRFDGDVDGHLYRIGDPFRIGSGNTFRRALGSDSATRIFADGRRVQIAEPGNGVEREGGRYHYGSGSARLGAHLTDALRLDARADALDARNIQAPGDINFGNDQNSYKNARRGGGELALSGHGSAGTMRARVYAGRETGDYFSDVTDARFVNFTQVTNTAGAQLEATTTLAGIALTAGADASRAEAKSSRSSKPGVAAATFSPDSRNGSAALFAQGRSELLGGRAILTLGGRLDQVRVRLLETPLRTDVSPSSDDFVVFNPSGGLVVPVGGVLRAHASAGRGFVTPDAFSRAGYSESAPVNNVVSFTVGNPNVRPEHAVTVDGGLGAMGAGFDADVTVFSTQVTDRITTASASYAAGSRPTAVDGHQISRVQTSVNAGSAVMRGIESSLGYDLGAAMHRPYRLRVSAEYTRLLTAVERTRAASVDTTGAGARTGVTAADLARSIRYGAESEVQIKNVAGANLTGALEYDDFSRFRGRLGARYVGRRIDNDFSDFTVVANVEYPPFLVLDATGGVRLTERVRADLAVVNLTDENYYEKRGYNLPGRSLQLRLTAAF